MMIDQMKTRNSCSAIVAKLTLSLSMLLATQAGATDVSVSVGGEIKPGVYGRIEFGTRPPPPVLYPQPVVIVAPPRQTVAAQPIYMHVPPGHAKKWAKHCHKYAACGQPVYFVQSPGEKHGKHKGKHKHHDKE